MSLRFLFFFLLLVIFFFIIILIILVLVFFDFIILFAKEPLLAGNFSFGLLLLNLLKFILGIKLLLPGKEGLNRNRRIGGKLRFFKDLLLLLIESLLLLSISFALDQVLLDPVTYLLHNLVDNGAVLVLVDYVFNVTGYCCQVVPSQSSHWLDLIFQGSSRVVRGELELQFDLILASLPTVRFTQNGELVW